MQQPAKKLPEAAPRGVGSTAPDVRKEVMMASQSREPATNERIVRLLEDVKAQLADSREQQERIARNVTQLLERK